MFCVRPKSVWCDAYPTTGMYKTYACSVMRMKFNVHDMMRNESYIRTQRTSTSKLLYAPCSYKHWAATASLLLGIFFGFIYFFWHACYYMLALLTSLYAADICSVHDAPVMQSDAEWWHSDARSAQCCLYYWRHFVYKSWLQWYRPAAA